MEDKKSMVRSILMDIFKEFADEDKNEPQETDNNCRDCQGKEGCQCMDEAPMKNESVFDDGEEMAPEMPMKKTPKKVVKIDVMSVGKAKPGMLKNIAEDMVSKMKRK